MFASSVCRPGRTSRKSGSRPRRYAARPNLDALEERWLLSSSTILVTSPDDTLHVDANTTIDDVNNNDQLKSVITLRDAIKVANNSGPGSVIRFGLPQLTVIKPLSQLPSVKDGVFIDGFDVNGDPNPIVVDGSLAGNSNGLVFTGTNSGVENLSIGHFQQAGILILGQGDFVTSCQVGANFNGNLTPNGIGIYVLDTTNVTLEQNFIPGNLGPGVKVEDCAQVFITSGGFLHGSSAITANVGDGVLIVGGKPVSGDGYVTKITGVEIDENQGAGVHIVNSSHNKIGEAVFGGFNWIGAEYEDPPVPTEGNLGDGVLIESTPGFQSTDNSVAYNFIASNGGNGVTLTGAGTTNNSVVKNRIGMTANFILEKKYDPETQILGNKHDGVAIINGAHGNNIGGTGLFERVDSDSIATVGDGNLILANLGNGVRVSGPGATMNAIQGNMIGTDVDGKTSIANQGDGVLIELGAANNLVGGPGQTARKTGKGNLISGNKQAGVHLRGAGTSGNQVQGNYVGTDISAANKLQNVNGVFIDQGASNNTVGGTAIAGILTLSNVISGNVTAGVVLSDAGTAGNVIQSNKIGTNLTGTAELPNAYGVLVTNAASGNLVGGTSAAAELQPAGNLISGNRLYGVAIAGQGTTNNWVEGNLIGTANYGLQVLPNHLHGVYITFSASGNFIGGGPEATGNLISGNGGSGVVIDPGADGNFVITNRIGTTASGLAPLGNTHNGVELLGSSNGVGWNVISANLDNGMLVHGSRNVIIANRIGTDLNGAVALGNVHDGILMNVVTGAGHNLVGAALPGAGNLISGNGWNGVEVTGPASANNEIMSNRIGTDLSGQQRLPNNRNGVFVNDTAGYVIGGSEPLAGNLISGNQWDGVLITGVRSTGILVLGNRIGTNAGGTASVPNLGNGVHLDKGADTNVIGGTGATDGNLISGNVLDGVLLGANHRHGNKVLGNRIGTDVNGLSALPNWQQGVEILGSSYNTIGGDAAGAGNLISGNSRDGVRVANGSDQNWVAGNLVGTDVTGAKLLSNQGNGVDLLGGSSNNTIGGVATTTSAPGNVISGNVGSGVVLTDAGTRNNRVQGNFIGTTKSGDLPLGNKADGVAALNGAIENLIGGDQPGAGNVIARNAANGVRIWGSTTSGNHVEGNWIGTDKTGQRELGNGGHGVWIATGAHDNSVGGLAQAKGNVIANNTKAGVGVGNFNMDATTLHNPILSNSIYNNRGLGIDLGTDGVTPFVPGGPHVGPNQFQNYPQIIEATASGPSTTIRFTVNSAPNSQFIVQIFASPTEDPTHFGEGKTLVYTTLVSTNGAGIAVVPPVTVPLNLAGQFVTASATSLLGDTSEFARNVQVAAGAGAKVKPAPGSNASLGAVVPSSDSERPNGKLEVGSVVGGPLAVTRPKRVTDAIVQRLLAAREGLVTPTLPTRIAQAPTR